MKYNDLEVNKIYTMFTISMMATTKKTTFKFLGFSTSGSMVYRKINDAGNSHKGTNWLPRNPDAIIIPGTSSEHGIYADSEVLLKHGNAPHFNPNAAFNLCSADEDSFMRTIEQHTSEKQRNSLCFFKIDNDRRDREGLFIYREEEAQQI